MASRLSVNKRKKREEDAEYVNGWIMKHKEQVAYVVDSFPRDGNFMDRCNRLREAILKTRGR